MLQEDDSAQAYENAKATLLNEDGTPTVRYQAYMKYEQVWKASKEAHQAAYAKAIINPLKLHMWAVEGKLYIDDINSALNKWLSFGYKPEIESALQIIANYDTSFASKNYNTK